MIPLAPHSAARRRYVSFCELGCGVAAQLGRTARFAEGGTGVAGVEITNRPVRQYPYHALGAHLLGYVGAVKHLSEQYDIDDFTFYEPDVEGKSQVERSLDRSLRGLPGARVRARGRRG